METMRAQLRSSLNSLPTGPAEKVALDELVKSILQTARSTMSPENQRAAWEYILKDEVLALAKTEGKALHDSDTSYYNQLQGRLDLVLTFTEQEACDQATPLQILQDLLETQTISSCSHIFSWIESRVERLTKDMVPQKGKALTLLRTLNELLRRLSKMESQNTEFCGRILMFLSQVFPLGERSGVNLRGEYGPVWDGPTARLPPKGHESMQVDEAVDDKKDDFYHTFWSLQLPFSRPPLFANPATFPAFKESVNKVLPVIKEATAKERAMMGSKSMMGTAAAGANKRKRETSESMEEPTLKNYFFAKFLTSPELLDLEIADTHFRRQFIFQLLILLQHLTTFTKTAKQLWSNSRNKGIHADFTLDPQDAQWVQETQVKCIEELKQTTPNGRGFADSVIAILEREKNWVRWKNEFCAPFDKEPWYEEMEVDGNKVKVGFEMATKEKRRKMMEDPEEWEHRFGSAPLTEIWEMGFKELSDLQRPFHPGDVRDFAKKVKQEDVRIDMRKKQLAKVVQARARAAEAKAVNTSDVLPASNSAAPMANDSTSSLPASVILHPSLPAKPASSPTPSVSPKPQAQSTPPPPLPQPNIQQDDIISKHEENKQRWNWLALRTARDQYLQHFGKIGSGDVVQLEQEIEKEKREARQPGEERAMSPMIPMSASGSKDGSSDGKLDVNGGSVDLKPSPEGDGDVKMDER